MTPFKQYYSRYLTLKEKVAQANFHNLIRNDKVTLNNLFMAGLGMGTLFLRMGAVIQMSEKLHDGDTSNDALFMKQVVDNLRETLPSDTNWKNLWYASIQAESKWEKAIPRDNNNNTLLDRFVTFRNKYVHQYICITPAHTQELERGLKVLEEMGQLYDLFETGEVLLKNEHYFWQQGSTSLELHPFVQKGEQEGLPYLFQGMYENKSKAKFINTFYGDETLPEINISIDEKFQPMQQALRSGAGKVFDHSERMQYYLDCFVGRDREVQSILEWVKGESVNNILPIYSEAGMGKGALTAAIINNLRQEEIPVMYHFCGSGIANSLHAVLYHFILQGKKMPGMNGAGVWKIEEEQLQRKMDRLPSRYQDAIHLFQKLLDACYAAPKKFRGKPLVIVIDGLDEAGVANSHFKVSDWFHVYNEKDEPEDDWKSPRFIKWIFTYRFLPGRQKDRFSLDGRLALEKNELVQPLKGLSEQAVRSALRPFDVSEEFIETVLIRSSVNS